MKRMQLDNIIYMGFCRLTGFDFFQLLCSCDSFPICSVLLGFFTPWWGLPLPGPIDICHHGSLCTASLEENYEGEERERKRKIETICVFLCYTVGLQSSPQCRIAEYIDYLVRELGSHWGEEK